MPLPRFQRLPAKQQQHLLTKAREHLARDGEDAASYNAIIADAGISKTSAYLYFDGKADLVEEVVRRLLAQLEGVLGVWVPARTATTFWAALRASSKRLQDHVRARPVELAVLARCPQTVQRLATDGWFEALLRNGQELGVVRRDVDFGLLVKVTAAVFRTVDGVVLEAGLSGQQVKLRDSWALLVGLWSAPPRQKTPRPSRRR